MGAKQSKRSVDISGKEAEGAGEVAAAGAGGEGRMEPLADADALKPQINGDAHIHEQTEKQLDSGTPENEKDATTEKEAKQEDTDKVAEPATPVTNGDSEEAKPENGETTPTQEDTKKPKKEKVKKKWSLRSISFSRKDKPKQEKKQKDEEAKTNGEPEKVPEETAEVPAEAAVPETPDAKVTVESPEEKTPETPVTEPITNGTTTPESPKTEDLPSIEETTPVVPLETIVPDATPIPEPEQLPINGLSIHEPKSEEAEPVVVPEAKADEPIVTQPEESSEVPPITTEKVAEEIPVQKEVCVDQMTLESTPPPLPMNPPPSSVVSFAATTMAPDMTDNSLSNPTETAILSPPEPKTDLLKECLSETPHAILTNDIDTLPPPPLTNSITKDHDMPAVVENNESTHDEVQSNNIESDTKNLEEQNPVADDIELPIATELSEPLESESLESPIAEEFPLPVPLEEDKLVETNNSSKPESESLEADVNVVNSNYINGDVVKTEEDDEILNGNDKTEQENIKNKVKDLLGNEIVGVECNGNVDEVVNAPKQDDARMGSPDLPPPPADCAPLGCPQQSAPTSDKITDLLPEIPVVPDLPTETLQETSDVVVAN